LRYIYKGKLSFFPPARPLKKRVEENPSTKEETTHPSAKTFFFFFSFPNFSLNPYTFPNLLLLQLCDETFDLFGC